MSDLIYRCVAHTGTKAQSPKSLADQMARPALVYRGVAHDGERPTKPAAKTEDLVYRGVRLA